MNAPAVPVGLVPRDYQLEGIAAARRILSEGVNALLLVLATGGGKTALAASVGNGAVAKGKRCLFIAPRREIIAQAFWKFVEAGVAENDLGIIMGDGRIPHAITRAPYVARRPMAPVQVASIQTLANRRLPPADVVFIDEAHHATSKTYQAVIDHYLALGAKIVGLTATPCRGDGKGLKAFERLHVIATFAQLAAKGFLLIPRVFTTPTPPDLTKVKVTSGGDYDPEALAALMDQRELVGDTVRHYQRLGAGRRAVIFAASVEHSRHLTEAFRDAGIAAAHVDGKTKTAERDAILGALRAGELSVVANYGVLTEGWDEPLVSYVALCRPTRSLALYLQMAGRGLRPGPGKPDALLVDHAGCVYRHGFPQDDREWSLEGRKARGAPSVRTCKQCYAALPAGTLVCPECGYEFPAEDREPAAELTTREDELAETDPETLLAVQVAFYEEALKNAARRGHKLGAARHRFQEKFKSWPRKAALVALEKKHYPPATVDTYAARVPAVEEAFDLDALPDVFDAPSLNWLTRGRVSAPVPPPPAITPGTEMVTWEL